MPYSAVKVELGLRVLSITMEYVMTPAVMPWPKAESGVLISPFSRLARLPRRLQRRLIAAIASIFLLLPTSANLYQPPPTSTYQLGSIRMYDTISHRRPDAAQSRGPACVPRAGPRPTSDSLLEVSCSYASCAPSG